jgi:FlaA1/EpsC-like NDP-sugar epimerase
MKEQNNKNHARMVPGFHYVLTPLALLTTLAAVVYWVWSMFEEGFLISSSLILLVSLITTIGLFFTRMFATTVQDRAIRAEENLRYYTLTGNLLDAQLSIKQIVALRFASDEEFPNLCKKTVEENLTSEEIKKAIKTWKADHNRV